MAMRRKSVTRNGITPKKLSRIGTSSAKLLMTNTLRPTGGGYQPDLHDNQRDASIEIQVRACKAHIERENWSLVGAYTDHAIGGATTLRSGYQTLLEDAHSGSFDVVLAEGLDRLGRDQEDIAVHAPTFKPEHSSWAGQGRTQG